MISKLVRDAIRERLADPAAGWTATHTALATEAGTPVYEINFGATSRQFFEGAIDVEDVLGSTAAKRPVMVLFTAASAHTGQCMGSLFSGQVNAILQVHLEQRSGNAVRDYETPVDVVEAALYRIFLARDWAKRPEITFGGELSITRGPVIPTDTNWRQTITARFTFGAHVDE